jgi:hypothetical protein
MRCPIACASLLLAGSALAPPCLAQGSSVEIEWTAPDACPDRADVVRRVEIYLGRPPAPSESLSFRADVRQSDDGHFRATLKSRWTGGSAERSFDGIDCVKIARATALIIAMAIDPIDVAEAVTEQKAEVRPSDEARPAPTVHDGGDLHFGFGIRTTVDAGSLPLPTIGGGPVASLRGGPWELDLAAAAWIPRRTSGAEERGAGGEISLMTGELRGCREIVPAALTVSLCLGGEVGVTDGIAFGILSPRHPRSPWVAPLLGFGVRPRLASGVWAWMSFDAAVPLIRPDYYIEGMGSVHRPWPIVARASMGVEIQGF